MQVDTVCANRGLAELFCLWWNGFHTCDSLKLNPIKLMYNTSKSIKAPPDCRVEKGIRDWSCESIQDWKELHGNKWPHAVCTRLTTQYQTSCRNIQKDLIHFIERKSPKKQKCHFTAFCQISPQYSPKLFFNYYNNWSSTAIVVFLFRLKSWVLLHLCTVCYLCQDMIFQYDLEVTTVQMERKLRVLSLQLVLHLVLLIFLLNVHMASQLGPKAG